jgi:hypothetical protein
MVSPKMDLTRVSQYDEIKNITHDGRTYDWVLSPDGHLTPGDAKLPEPYTFQSAGLQGDALIMLGFTYKPTSLFDDRKLPFNKGGSSIVKSIPGSEHWVGEEAYGDMVIHFRMPISRLPMYVTKQFVSDFVQRMIILHPVDPPVVPPPPAPKALKEEVKKPVEGGVKKKPRQRKRDETAELLYIAGKLPESGKRIRTRTQRLGAPTINGGG